MPTNQMGVNKKSGKKRAKRGKKSDSFYITAHKNLKKAGMKNFKDNLKYNSSGDLINKKITPAIKRKITIAHNELTRTYKNADYLPLPKKKGESIKKYKKRVRRLKKEHNQKHSFDGLLMYTDPMSETRLNSKGEIITSKWFNDNQQIMTIEYILIPGLPEMILKADLDGLESFAAAIRKALNAAFNRKSIHSSAHFYYGQSYSGQGVYFIENYTNRIDSAVERLKNLMIKYIGKYDNSKGNHVVGLVVKSWFESHKM